MDSVIGIDVHMVAPIPGIPIHPYCGSLYLWTTPQFPTFSSGVVLINGMPACTVGSMGISCHCVQGIPIVPTPTNAPYWKRYLCNVPMVLTLTGLTIMANIAIAGIAALIPKPKSAEGFLKDVTGIDTTDLGTTWESIKGSFAAFTKWQTWAKLLMPPVPYPGAQGSAAVGSPNVTVNGGCLAFSCPLMATSCSDIPMVPNAATLGFTNVMVGVSVEALARGLAVHTAQSAIAYGVRKGLEPKNDDCDRPGHPIDPVTGASQNEFIDFEAPGVFRWERYYSSAWNKEQGPLGFGFRHSYQRELRFGSKQIVYIDGRHQRVFFHGRVDGSYHGASDGYELFAESGNRFILRHATEGTLTFLRTSVEAVSAKLVERVRGGRREVITYDTVGRLARMVQTGRTEDGAEITFRYNPRGELWQIVRTTEKAGAQVIVRYSYNEGGCLVEVRNALNAVTSFAFDAEKRVIRETDANGYSFHYEYDAAGRCVASAGDDGLWRVALRYAPGRTLVTEADGGLWVFSHNEAGTVTEIMDPYGGRRQRLTGPSGRVLQEVDSGGRTMLWLYDEKGRHHGRLDRWGNVWPTKAEAPRLPNPLTHQVPRSPEEREWGETRPEAGVGELTFPWPIRETAKRLLTAGASPQPQVVRRDALQRLVEQTDPDGLVQRFSYDPLGNCVSVWDKDGQQQQREYGSWKLCLARIDPLGNTTRYRYTPRQKVAAIVDPVGNESEYAHDYKDRLIQVKRHGVIRENYRYDIGDRLIEKRDGEDNPLLTLEIGANGLQSKRVLASGEEHRFAYDRYGNITEASTSESRVLIGYRERRRVSDLRDGRGVEHCYEDQRLASTTYFGRFTVRYEILGPGDALVHTPAGRPYRIMTGADGARLRLIGNGTRELSRFDAAGRCIGRLTWRDENVALARAVIYQYSGTGELRSKHDSLRGTTTYRYDAAHRLVECSGADSSCSYLYDASGNILSKPSQPELRYGDGNRLAAGRRVTYKFNGRNHLSEIVCADGKRTQLEYDSMDLLVGVTSADGCAEWKAEYDGLCRRIAKSVDGVRTAYFWDGDRLAAEESAEGGLRIYIYPHPSALIPLGFIDYPSAKADPRDGRAHYVFHDQVGLPVLIEDGGGTEVWRAASVEPYGTIAVAPGHLVDYNLRFPGHYYDPETGLHYNRFRSYSPALGRYLQSDPAGQSGGTNLYAYVPNPLTDVDVLGLAPSHKGNNSNGEKPKASGRQMEEVDDEYEEVMVTNSAGVMVTRTYVQEKDELFEVACAAAGGYLGPPEWTKYKDSYYRNEDNSRVIEWNEQGHQNTKEGPHVKVMDYNPDRNKHEVQSKTFVQDWDEYKPSPAYWKRQNQRYQDAADQDPQGPSHGDAPPPDGKTGEGDND